MSKHKTKVVVFDLDETLGHFVEIGVFSDLIEKYNKKKLTDKQFFEIMDLFPEVLRPNIINILNFLKEKKKSGVLNKVYIYTNNQGPKSWAEKIKRYLEHKINYKLFDKVIGAYQLRSGEIIEKGRTTNNKTIDDLMSITKLPFDSEICFLDDVEHHEMFADNVFYRHVKPYSTTIPFTVMAHEYYNKHSNSITNESAFINFISSNMKKYHLDINNRHNENHIIEGKEILQDLKEFLKVKSKNKTIKKGKKSKRKTTKKKR